MDDSPRLPLGKARSLSLPADHEANFLATFPSSTSSYGSTTNIKRYGSVRGGNMVPYSLVIVGAPDTGKTSLTVRFISAKFLSGMLLYSLNKYLHFDKNTIRWLERRGREKESVASQTGEGYSFTQTISLIIIIPRSITIFSFSCLSFFPSFSLIITRL